MTSVTDGSGTVLGLNKYDEYGVPQTTNLGKLGYTAQAWVPEVGLWYYKARFYRPDIGRFMQTDPIGYEGDGPNVYAYVLNDPVNLTDPLGLDPPNVDGGAGCGDECVTVSASRGIPGGAALLRSGSGGFRCGGGGNGGKSKPKSQPRNKADKQTCLREALWENKAGLLLDIGGWALEVIPVTKVGKALAGMGIGAIGVVAGAMEKDLAAAGFAYGGKQGAIGEGLGLGAAKRLGTTSLAGSTVYDLAKARDAYIKCMKRD